nr:hypothetical protein [Tanacetum cinerariifolium]
MWVLFGKGLCEEEFRLEEGFEDENYEGSHIPDNSKKGLGYKSYHAVSPPPIGLFSPLNIDLSNSGLEFQQPKFEGYGPKTSKTVNEDISKEVKESPAAPLVKDRISNSKDCSVESPVEVEKKIVVPTVTKIEFVRAKQQEKPVRKPVQYAEMYRPRSVNTARPRAVNTARPRLVSTARPNLAVINAVMFWATAKVKNVNGEAHIQALVDKKKVIITETSIRRDLRFEDEGGVDCLSNEVIFKQLRFMREVNDFSGKVTPLFETMMVQPSEDMGGGRMNEEYMFGVNDLDGGEVVVDVSASKNVEQSVKVVEKKVSTADPVTTAAKPKAITAAAIIFTATGIRPEEKRIKAVRKHKRAADKLEQDDAKRQRIEEENESVELKRCLEIIPEDDDAMTIEATPLSSKSPTIVDYKIYKERRKSFFKIIKADEFMLTKMRSRTYHRRDKDLLENKNTFEYKIMSSSNYPFIVPSDFNIVDAFSSTNTPDYTSASPDYLSASPGNTSPDLLNDLRHDDEIVLSRVRTSNLEMIIEDIQVRHRSDKKDLLDAIYELKNRKEGPLGY